MLKVRILTAAVLIALVLYGLFFTSIIQYQWILIGLAAFAGWEWSGFMRLSTVMSRVFYIGGLIIFTLVGLFLFPPLYSLIAAAAWWVVALMLVSVYPKSKPILEHKLLVGVIGLLVIEPMITAFVLLRQIDNGIAWLFYGLCLVWVADTGAYFSGKRWGKNKLAPAVSPGKTIEGIWGSIAASIALVVIASHTWLPEGVSIIKLLMVTLFLVPISVLGDLTESLFKRNAGIKDSGRILPGHGGVLDRIDGLTSTVPIFAIAFQIGLL